jgi:hypothetical protein
MKYSVDSYAAETKYITALALRESEPGVSARILRSRISSSPFQSCPLYPRV